MSFAYVWIGLRHLTNRDFILTIMHPYSSEHLRVFYLSGAFEIVFGFGLLTKLRKYAAKGLILLLIFVFPANIYLISSQEAQIALDISRNMAIVRAPFQLVFIAIAYWHSLD